MIRIYKKWWLLQQFDKQQKKHTFKDEQNVRQDRRVWSRKKFFIEGNPEYAGIVYRGYITGKYKEFNLQKINLKKLDDLNDIFDSCVREKYLALGTGSDGHPMPIKGESFDDMLGIPKLIHHEYNGLTGFWKTLGWLLAIVVALGWQKPILNIIKSQYHYFIESQRQQEIKIPNEIIKPR